MCRPLQNIFFVGTPKQRQLNKDRIKDLFPKLKAFRDEHGLLQSVANTVARHQWYDDLERTDEEKASQSTLKRSQMQHSEAVPESNYPEADDFGLPEPGKQEIQSKAYDLSEHKDDGITGKMPLLERVPKPYPGDYFKDQYPNKVDPRGEPDYIEFKWNKNFKNMDQCDTIHMLYLLQIACDLHRRRVIERNKYFMSIARADRYIAHVDAPQIITNFINWHNEDKERNVFLGEMLKTKKEVFMINEMISDIGTLCL